MSPSGWEPLLGDYDDRVAAARAMGAPAKLARQHEGGRLDARGRVDHLLDPGTFTELGTLVGSLPGPDGTPSPADALVAGWGAIDGRTVMVGAEDFTVHGGSIGIGTHAKRLRLVDLAVQERVPLVMLLDGAGERAQNSLERYPRAPNDLSALARASGLIPMVAAVMGPSAGHGALAAPLMDFVVMVHGAAIFAAGPPLVAEATGEQVSKEALGGVAVHVDRSGVAHNAVADDDGALALIRRYLSYFPSNAWSAPARDPGGGDVDERLLDTIVDLVPVDPRQGYDIRPVLELMVDDGAVLEVQPDYGRSVVTALARLGGRAVALLANQPAVRAGAFDGPSVDKAARFIDVVGAFHLPVVFLADNPGVMAGSGAEADGLLRRAARLYAAQARLTSPKLHVTVRKAYGFGSSLMAMNPFDGQTLTLAFPGARLGAMPAGGGGHAAGATAETQDRLDRAELDGGYRSADRLSYDEVIDPRRLRNALLSGLRLCATRLDGPTSPVSHHGILP